jgi:hypothetical protein
MESAKSQTRLFFYAILPNHPCPGTFHIRFSSQLTYISQPVVLSHPCRCATFTTVRLLIPSFLSISDLFSGMPSNGKSVRLTTLTTLLRKSHRALPLFPPQEILLVPTSMKLALSLAKLAAQKYPSATTIMGSRPNFGMPIARLGKPALIPTLGFLTKTISCN